MDHGQGPPADRGVIALGADLAQVEDSVRRRASPAGRRTNAMVAAPVAWARSGTLHGADSASEGEWPR